MLGALPHHTTDEYNAIAEWEINMNVDVKLTAVYLKVPEGYIGFVEELPGANTQGPRWRKRKQI